MRSLHNCSALYTNVIHMNDGTSIELSGRERPALLFDRNVDAPIYLYNGAIAYGSKAWYAMAQAIKFESKK